MAIIWTLDDPTKVRRTDERKYRLILSLLELHIATKNLIVIPNILPENLVFMFKFCPFLNLGIHVDIFPIV